MNISSIKTNSADSPKTPGGISKSLLTPCRRVGLSRKWKKSGVSPFISPLGSSSSNKEVKLDNEIRKRKKCNAEVEEKDLGEDSREEINSETCDTPKIEIDRTPTRALLPRKKSKTVITIQKYQEAEKKPQSVSELSDKNIVTINNEKLLHDSTKQVSNDPNLITNDENMEIESIKQVTKVTKLSRKNSKSSNKIKILESPVKNTIEPNLSKTLGINDNNEDSESKNNAILQDIDNVKVNVKEKSPNNLTKKCIVVIQKKIFKTDRVTNNNTSKRNAKEPLTNKSASQSLFDSDTDDVPLCNLNKPDNKSKTANNNALEQITQIQNSTNAQKLKETNNAIEQNSQNIIDLTSKDSEDTDFVETKKVNISKPDKTSITGIKNNTKDKPKTTKLQAKCISKPSPQSSNCDEDDDFDYSRKRTILVKKTYDNIGKLAKAKSTGSITQKDIDDITARIESKKNMLLAKAMTNETKELRELIKKWQVGCQTALMELLDLMRQKLPEQNMEQSELLQMLKIPPDLVGYDSDSDNFNTPDDTAIILSALKLN